MTLRTNYSDGGATPVSTNVTALDMNAISTAVNNSLTLGAGVPAANIPNGITNFNTANQSQVCVAGTKYYVAGSQLALPATLLTGMVANKTTFIWDVALNKDAASTGGTFSIIIGAGTAGTSADFTAGTLVSQSLGTLAASADNITVEVQMTVTTTGSSGVFYWSMIPTHMGSGFGLATGAAGHFTGSTTAFNLTTPALIFGLGFVASTATPTIGIPQVQSSTYNLD